MTLDLVVGQKVCTWCRRTLPHANFHRDRGGYVAHCMACRRQHTQFRRMLNDGGPAYERWCHWCKLPFIARHMHAQYCSPEHRHHQWRTVQTLAVTSAAFWHSQGIEWAG